MYIQYTHLIPSLPIVRGSIGRSRGGGGFFFVGGGGGGDGDFALTCIIIVIAVVFMLCMCKAFLDQEAKDSSPSGVYTKCYLCLDKVSQAKWDDGTHRKECIQKNRSLVDAMPRPYPLNCPNCAQRLRQWPERGPEVWQISYIK